MCLGVIVLPVGPCIVGHVEVYPLISGAGEVIRGEKRLGGDGNERVIGDGEVGKLVF